MNADLLNESGSGAVTRPARAPKPAPGDVIEFKRDGIVVRIRPTLKQGSGYFVCGFA